MDVDHAPKSEPNNLVICCDGTAKEISENISNVLKFYRCLRKTDKTKPRKMVFCDTGVDTVDEADRAALPQGHRRPGVGAHHRPRAR